MCSVSMIGDHYNDIWRDRPWYPNTTPAPMPGTGGAIFNPSQVTRAEFDDLKRQVTEMTALLKRAKRYDEDNGEPDCEMDEKMDLLRRVAKMVGVDLDHEMQREKP